MTTGEGLARVEGKENNAIFAGHRAVERVDLTIDHQSEQNLDTGDRVAICLPGFDADIDHATQPLDSLIASVTQVLTLCAPTVAGRTPNNAAHQSEHQCD